tara:strand:+ start:90 stop:731 length:642 start_codon:yes stop_codon:yes gene_type:complete
MNNNNKVAILDYGTGNIASIFKALRNINAEPYLVSNYKEINKVPKLILPGVGHFGEAIKHLKKFNFIESLHRIREQGVPILGICLGFQLLAESSEESLTYAGLGFLPIKVTRINTKDFLNYKCPHIGWNSIEEIKSNLVLMKGINSERQLFYFCNAYGVEINYEFKIKSSFYFHESKWLATVEKDNIFGVQFHPEKSRNQGLKLLNNFLNYQE